MKFSRFVFILTFFLLFYRVSQEKKASVVRRGETLFKEGLGERAWLE